MMEKKRSIGVVILVILMILYNIPAALCSFLACFKIGASLLISIVTLAFGIAFIICGINLFMLKEWARKATIWVYALRCIWTIMSFQTMTPEQWSKNAASLSKLSHLFLPEVAMSLIIGMIIFFPVVWLSIVLFFLTRPKVKRQFVNEEGSDTFDSAQCPS